jgi:hypothetical protein
MDCKRRRFEEKPVESQESIMKKACIINEVPFEKKTVDANDLSVMVGSENKNPEEPQQNTNLDNIVDSEVSQLKELVMDRDIEVDGISAQEFLLLQQEIEREAMARFPGQIDTCTYSLGIPSLDRVVFFSLDFDIFYILYFIFILYFLLLGPLNQAVYVCLTCNPPDARTPSLFRFFS